jgi:hypothetical protein
MKKLFTILSLVLVLSFSANNQAKSQTGFNTVIEYCTGTWCQWCPCGHDILDAILVNYPETVVLAYHGAGTDPWQSYSAGIRALMGMSSYPTGVIGRRSGVISRTAWNNQVVLQSNTVQPQVELNLAAFNYNSSTREVTATVEAKALANLNGEYKINFVLTESNVIYPQTGNGSCPGSATYEHDHIVKGMLNGDLGEVLSTGTWNQNEVKTANITFTIDAGFVAENCDLNYFVWQNTGSLTTQSITMAAKHTSVDNPTNIQNNNTAASSYDLKQNYPNPFNPTTHIQFSVPRDGNVSLKFYDMLGNEVASYIDNGFLRAGTYSAEFNGEGLSSGVYFYTLSSNDFSMTKKMILTK